MSSVVTATSAAHSVAE